nr:galactan 1,3-beta-galactosidase [Colletotrichum truncatum]KAF6794709.1 galactan 1,3-beta-galactosidase [Colletotrichum truncatum]
MRLLNGLASLLAGAGLVEATLQIISGGTWTATNTGRHIQAHGAGIIKVGSTYYMIGEDKTEGSAFQNINCYSSTNLVEWAYVGALLSRTNSGDLGPSRVVERPKVIYNESTRKYVLYMHIDSSNYGEAEVGVATSDTVCGKYTYLASWRPLGFQSRDIGLYKDDDGSAYLLSEDRANGLRIDALTSDYLNVTHTVHLWPDRIEAPAILKRNGYYFMFGSKLTGWDPNDNVCPSPTFTRLSPRSASNPRFRSTATQPLSPARGPPGKLSHPLVPRHSLARPLSFSLSVTWRFTWATAG